MNVLPEIDRILVGVDGTESGMTYSVSNIDIQYTLVDVNLLVLILLDSCASRLSKFYLVLKPSKTR